MCHSLDIELIYIFVQKIIKMKVNSKYNTNCEIIDFFFQI